MFQTRRSVAIVTWPVASSGAVPVRSSRRRRCTAPTCRSRSSWSGATARSGSPETSARARSWRRRRGGICRSGRSWRSGTARSGTGWSGATEGDWREYLFICEPHCRIQGAFRATERPKVACFLLKNGRSVLIFVYSFGCFRRNATHRSSFFKSIGGQGLKRAQGKYHQNIYWWNQFFIQIWAHLLPSLGGGGAQPNIWGLGHSQRDIKLRSWECESRRLGIHSCRFLTGLYLQ